MTFAIINKTTRLVENTIEVEDISFFELLNNDNEEYCEFDMESDEVAEVARIGDYFDNHKYYNGYEAVDAGLITLDEAIELGMDMSPSLDTKAPEVIPVATL